MQISATGYDTPPPPLTAGKNTYYYFGPGGGGVSYSDKYFLNLRGQILMIDFEGPYESGQNTPTAATKDGADRNARSKVKPNRSNR